ncbi:MAG: YraN family protein [Terriglobia bacterium]
MPLFARLMFGALNYFAARGGLCAQEPDGAEGQPRARRTGIRGETFAYWFLRRHGYLLVRRNYRVPNRHGEIDLIGWDGSVLAFIEVKTRISEGPLPPEAALTAEKRKELRAMAREYLRRRHLQPASYRFDLVAIVAPPGCVPTVRLHKGVFGEQQVRAKPGSRSE